MGGTTQHPSLEACFGRLEGDTHEVNGTLGRLEPLIVVAAMSADVAYLPLLARSIHAGP